MKTATRPEVFNNLSSIKSHEEAEQKGITEEEIHLSNLTEQKGWQILSETKDRLIQELDQVNELAIEKGAPYEEIGRNTLVISVAKGIINRLWAKAQDAKEAYERTGGA